MELNSIVFEFARRFFSWRRENPSFYDLLQRHTNLPANTRLSTEGFRLVERFGPRAARKPDIYLFVVDSLRRDYVGDYNPKVRFTPNIDAFARENFALPEAVIWAGVDAMN